MNPTQISNVPLYDLREEIDTLYKIKNYRMFADDESQELINKTLTTLREKFEKEMKVINHE
jgi:hypothetical protein